MRLKSLEIQGFKTFPDKTKLSFENGITSVVGPNGSGKSNISDAIRWVLGEQSPKSLRCSRMEDVVFNGTDKRKRTGYAEVTLNIDNSDRFLDFNGDEISVTRRYYRSGDSEYLINKASVRLKDINELFMDTGLGRDGYSMIGQGKIDSIVSSKSEDRREIFEEAAGISRYRYRKIEAERRLKSTEENLLRLRDIVTGLEDRVEPLRKQSENAHKFLEYSEEKRGLEIALWLQTLDGFTDSLKQQDERIAVARSQYEDADAALADIQKETEESYLKSGEYSAKIEQLRKKSSDTDIEIAGVDSQITVANNDIQHHEENIERINLEIEQADVSTAELEKTISEKQTRINALDEAIISKQREHAKLYEKLNAVNLESGKSGDKLQEITSALSLLTLQSSDARVTEMSAESGIKELLERIEALKLSNEERAEHSRELNEILCRYRDEIKEAEAELISLNNTIEGLELKLESRSSKKEKLRDEAEKLRLERNNLQQRITFLENLERNLEGFSKSVKSVVNASKNGKLRGICGPVSRLISTETEYGAAIETALGAAMQNIIIENEEDAKQAIRYLKSTDGGRATFLPLTTIKPRELNERGLEDCYGFIGIASQLCVCEDKYRNILSNLLGRIAVAENLNSAVSIASKYSYRFKVVTLDGQVVNAGGSLTGGSLNKNTGLLSRSAEIDKLRASASKLDAQSGELQTRLDAVTAECSSTEAQLLGSKADYSNCQQNHVRLTVEEKACNTEIENTDIQIKQSEQEISGCLEKIEALKEKSASAKSILADLSVRIADAEQRVTEVTGSRTELTKQREELTEALQSVSLEIVAAQKDVEALNSEIVIAKNAGSDNEDRISELRQSIEQHKESIEDLRVTIVSLEKDRESLVKSKDGLRGEIESFIHSKEVLEKRDVEIRRVERDKMAERENSGRELARLEERKLNIQKEHDTITAKLWDEYELTEREAKKTAVEIDNTAKANKRLNQLRQNIKALGNVNVSAIEEYKEVSEKYEFMSAQVSDVEKSKAEIERIITGLTKQMKEVFAESFEQINKHFTYTFKELFGGGTASLSLSEPDNLLTSGIDILVHPPGKIVVHLDALSGGEKALVAIALYFSIMKVRPAPFCVMDEIEAALDDVNVYRFASYLRNLSKDTQFILITHRRGTMEEADVLYGVTMQDEGISKLLELRSSEVVSKLGIETK